MLSFSKCGLLVITYLLSSLSLQSAAVVYSPAAQDDEITNLPGTEGLEVQFKQFSGYIDVEAIERKHTEENGERRHFLSLLEGKNNEAIQSMNLNDTVPSWAKNYVSEMIESKMEDGDSYTKPTSKFMHYWFVEAETNPETAPIVLWTNGGPGCSGLLGFLTEQGSFRPQPDGNLALNPYAWNKIANMVFIEQPVGVGFSYATDENGDIIKKVKSDDVSSAKDNYYFLVGFLERYSAFKGNEVYITSESYGGHYMPTLTATILYMQEGNDNAFNFKGFMVGNPFTSFINNNKAMFDTYWGKQLVPIWTYNEWKKVCAESWIENPAALDACLVIEGKMSKEMGGLNPYALDYPTCISNGKDAQILSFIKHVVPSSHKDIYQNIFGVNAIDIEGYDPCVDNYAVKYLNRPEVKQALHVKESIVWSECSAALNYKMTDEFIPMEPLYEYFIKTNDVNKLKMLVYSGDDDAVCALSGTQEWFFNLNVNFKKGGKKWETWNEKKSGQIAGYVTQMEGDLTLITVHSAGHEVPTYQPEAALQALGSYLDGTWFN